MELNTYDRTIREIYLDGVLKEASEIDGSERSYAIFMHSLILSSIPVNNRQPLRLENYTEPYDQAAVYYAASQGFNRNLIASVAPKVCEIKIAGEPGIHASGHLINEQMRVVSRGKALDVLKRCSFVMMDSKMVKMTRKLVRRISETLETMNRKGLDVYAIAIKDLSPVRTGEERDMVSSDYALVALVGV